jgi:hypothetical protein
MSKLTPVRVPLRLLPPLEPGLSNAHSDSGREMRREEKGILRTPVCLELYVHAQCFPVWLLALDPLFVKHLWISGSASLAEFSLKMTAQGVDLILVLAALDNIGTSR